MSDAGTHRSPPLAERRLLRAFFGLVFVVFTCVYPFIASVNNPNENVRTYETMAIVEDHTFRIDRIVEEYGWVNDMAAVPEPDGSRHLFSVKAPATSYIGVPVYWAMTKIAPRLGHPVPTRQTPQPQREWWFRTATFMLRLFAIQLPCFAFLVWLERWLRGVSADPILRLAAVAAAGLGTNYLAYSLAFVSHATFAVCAFASFAITTRERANHPLDPKQRRLSQAFLAGLFAGLATLFEYHALPVSVCLSLYAMTTFWRPTRVVMFGIGGMVSALALMWFQWRCFKSPFTPGHKMSENPLYAHLLSQGLFGIGTPDASVFKSISLDLGYGFFGTSPFMWLGFLAVPFVLIGGLGHGRERPQARLATSAWMFTMLALWLTVSAAINWRGGWTIGPRYLGAAPPFFAYGALCALESVAGRSPVRRALVRGLAGGMAVASVLTIGIPGLHFNTLPEDISRPLVQFAWPMAKAGFVPYHAMEWLGWSSATFWYVCAACAVGAALLAAFAPWREARAHYILRSAVTVAAFALAIAPAILPATPIEVLLGGHVRHTFAAMWHPPGRDRLTSLRADAERLGPRGPCAWQRLVNLERSLDLGADVARDETKIPPGTKCNGFIDRVDSLLSPPAASLAPSPAGPSSGTSKR